jgi:pentatricopeptide repeat protein
VSNSAFDSCNYGAYIDGQAGGGFASGIIFQGCWFGTNAGNGVVALQAQGLRVTNSSINNNGSHGIGLYDQCYDALIEGCVVAGNSVGALYVYSGIKIAGVSSGAAPARAMAPGPPAPQELASRANAP